MLFRELYLDNIAAAWAVDREFANIFCPFGLPLGVFWTPLPPSGMHPEFTRKNPGRFVKIKILLNKTDGLGHALLAWNLPGGTWNLPGDPVSSTAAWDPPTTRAGGQDDGSYTKLLQIIGSFYTCAYEVSYPGIKYILLLGQMCQ